MTSKEALKHITEDDFNMIITTYPPKPAYNGLTKEDMIAVIEKDLDKLNQLEDIEEEIEIDLITKDKVEKNRYVFVNYQNSIEINQVEIKKYGRLGIDIYDKNAVFKYNYLPYKDYGKTWARTKEELE